MKYRWFAVKGIKSWKFRLKINKNRINKIKNRYIKLAQYHKLNNQKLFKI